MTVSVDLMRARLGMHEEHRFEFEGRAEVNGGSLPRSDWWRLEYCTNPYLLGCPDDRLASRFHDVFINQTELSPKALIGLLPVDNDNQFMRKFTHLLEEYAVREGLPNLHESCPYTAAVPYERGTTSAAVEVSGPEAVLRVRVRSCSKCSASKRAPVTHVRGPSAIVPTPSKLCMRCVRSCRSSIGEPRRSRAVKLSNHWRPIVRRRFDPRVPSFVTWMR